MVIAGDGRSTAGTVGTAGEVLGGEIPEMQIFGTDALETGDGALGGADGGELGDQVRLAGSVQLLEMGRTGVGQVVEVEGVGDQALEVVICQENG